MNNERTHDLFEPVIEDMELPPVPISTLSNRALWENFGVKYNLFSSAVIFMFTRLSGFSQFYKELENQIDYYLRTVDTRSSAVFNPVIAASLVIEDAPANVNAYERAAGLILAAREFYENIQNSNISPDTHKGIPLEMGEYPNFFSTSQVIENGRARLFKSAQTDSLTIIVKKQIFILPLWKDGATVSYSSLCQVLEQIAEEADRNSKTNNNSPAILTAAPNAFQIKAFSDLQKEAVNSQSMDKMKHSFFTVILEPDQYPEGNEEVLRKGHASNYANRWFHSSFQMISYGNGKACFICSFSAYLTGNVMVRGSSEIQKRANKYYQNQSQPAKEITYHYDKLQWQVKRETIENARTVLHKFLYEEKATFTIDGKGTQWFEANQLKPVPTFTAALQIALHRMITSGVRILQFMSMSKYCCMDVITGNVSTADLISFADYMTSDDKDKDHARKLLDKAIASQVEAIRQCRSFLPLEEIIPLYFSTQPKWKKRWTALWAIVGGFILRLFGLYKMRPREVVISHPEIYKEIPLIGRPGVRIPYVKYFGLHYQIHEQYTTITMMPGMHWNKTNVETVRAISDALDEIGDIVH
ncbi:MAG: hypothetical protein GF313_06810 [Caldithrix sp.]|nr:hypothetical protein [Caldithrix sp.]